MEVDVFKYWEGFQMIHGVGKTVINQIKQDTLLQIRYDTGNFVLVV